MIEFANLVNNFDEITSKWIPKARWRSFIDALILELHTRNLASKIEIDFINHIIKSEVKIHVVWVNTSGESLILIKTLDLREFFKEMDQLGKSVQFLNFRRY